MEDDRKTLQIWNYCPIGVYLRNDQLFVMDIFLSIAAFVLSVLGIIGCVAPLLPGPALSFCGLLCAYGCSYSTIPGSAVLLWLAAMLAVSAADYFLPAYMTRLMGGSRAGQIGATIGLLVGMLFFFSVVSLILCPFFGAVIGELIHDRKDSGRAFRSGFGSFIAFAVGTGVKLVVCVGMFIHVVTDTWPVLRDWTVGLF